MWSWLWNVERNFSPRVSVLGDVKHQLPLAFCSSRKKILTLNLVLQTLSIEAMLIPTYVFNVVLAKLFISSYIK